jgi:hypothetical protein
MFVPAARLAGAIAICVALVACGSPSAAINDASSNSVEGLVLHAGADTLVKVAYDTDPVLGAIAKLGVYGVKLATKKIRLLASEPTATVLVIRQVINGKASYSVYKITTDRKLVVALNGQFVEYISAHKIVIDVRPDTPSTIAVTVKDRAGIVYRKGAINVGSKQPYANFDTGRSGNLPKRDAELSWKTHLNLYNTIKGLNGTIFYRWPGKGAPTLANCASVPAADWSVYIQRYITAAPRGTTWCMHTGRGRFGVLARNSLFSVTGITYLYVLWKKPSDMSR